MLVNAVIDYIVLDVAVMLGLEKELSEYVNKYVDEWTPEQNYIEQIHIDRLVFKVRPIYAERTNQCEIRFERLG